MSRTTSVLSVLGQSILLAGCAASEPMQPAGPVDVTTVTTSAEPLRTPTAEPPAAVEPPPAAEPRLGGPAATSSTARPAASDDVAARPPLSDAAILGVIEAARRAQREQARDAIASAQDPHVTELAHLILTDRIDGKLVHVASTLAGGGAESPTATQLQANHLAVTAGLRAATPAQFDAAYVATQVSELTNLTHLIDDTLLPQARDGEVRRLLEDLRQSAGKHLGMASGIRRR
jgi:putative membrane protein